MDNFNRLRIQRGAWIKKEVTKDKVVYQCSECGNIDDPKKKVCSCCKAEMEVENG